MKNLNSILYDTDPKHSHMLDSIAYMYAAHEAKLTNEYILMFIKAKPWWLPKWLYHKLLSLVVNLANFKFNK